MPYQSTWNNPYATNPYGYQMVQPTVTAPQPSYGSSQAHWHQRGGSVKVNGQQSAMQFGQSMPPNSESDPLFDAAGGVFYIVSTDGAGVPSVEAFDYTPHVQETVQIDGAQFVSRQEFDEFTAKVNAAIGAINNGIHGPVQASTTTNAAQGKDVNATPDDAGRPLGIG